MTLSRASIQIEAGDTSQVTATYQFQIGSPGSGDQRLTAISGTLWEFPGRSVSGYSATVDGDPVELELTDNPQHTLLSVPVGDVQPGERVEVTLSYQVNGPAGQLKAPVWVPEFETQGRQNVIEMIVTLPDGTRPQGDAFPNIDRRTDGGSTLEYGLLHVPSFVFMTYGQGGGGVTINTLSSLGGVLFILVFFGLWVWYTRRTLDDRVGGGSDVA